MPQQTSKTETKESEEKLGGKYTDENLISIKKQLEDGSTYILEDDTLDFAYDVFSKLVNTDNKTLCITRKHPEKIQEEYKIGDTDFVWLSTSNESIAVGPQQLDVLSLTIEGFISDEGDTLFIDGLGYLFSNNPVSTITQFLQSIQDQITTGNTKLIFAASPSSLEDKYYNLLKNELNPEIISLLEKTKVQEKDTEISKGETEDLVDDMQNMVNYLEDEERELEEKVNKLNQQNIPEPQKEGTSDVVMEAINSLRDEITTLRNRLDEEKSKGAEVDRTKKPSEEIPEETKAREEKIRSIVKEKQETTTEEESTEEEKTEEVTDEKMRKIIDLVEDRIKTEEEEEEIPEEYIEKIIDEVKRELKAEEEIDTEESTEKEDIIEETEEKTIEKEEDIESYTPEIEEEVTEEKTSEEETESETPTVGDILNTVKREKEKETEPETEDEKMKIKEGFHVKGSLESDDDIILKNRSTVDGDVTSINGDVIVGEDCTINGTVQGKGIDVSEGSDIEEIDAEKDVTLGKEVKVNRIKTEGDVELHQGVTVEEEIEYGEHLFFKGDDIKVGNLIHPVKNEEVVEEQWVSQ